MHFLRPSEQIFATSLPTRVLPVKVTFLTTGCLQSASLSDGVFSREVGRTLKTPFGKPACCARFASASTEKGVSGDGLTIIVQPAANAAPAFRRIIAMGTATSVSNLLVISDDIDTDSSMAPTQPQHRSAA